MREIKFRVWDQLLSVMIYDDFTVGSKGDLFFWDRETGAYTDIKPSTEAELMRWTGLKDKNGKEIYEGDILKTDGIDGKCLWRIDFEESSYVYGFSPTHANDEFSAVHNHVWEEGIVIGNIYENPNLLKS